MKVKKRTIAEKKFTDRTEPQKTYRQLLDMARENLDEFFVLVYYGIGGVGKSSLIRKLAQYTKEREIKYIIYDFDEGTNRRNVILRFKNMLKKQGFSFPLLETAEYLHAQKSGTSTEQEIEKKEEGLDNPYIEILVSAVDLVVPGASLITSIAQCAKDKLLDKENAKQFFDKFCHKYFSGKENSLKKQIKDMKELEASELLEHFDEYFSTDLVNAMEDSKEPLVIFLDTYEMLVNTYNTRGWSVSADAWLRDKIVANIPGIVWVIGGRERLGWDKFDNDWEGVEQHLLGDLSIEDASDFLSGAGIAEKEFHEYIYNISGGIPVFLDICVDLYWQFKDSNKDITKDVFLGSPDMLIERYLRYMEKDEKQIAQLLAYFSNWTDEEAIKIGNVVIPNFNEEDYREFIGHTIIRKDDDGMRYFMHSSVQRVINKSISESFKRKVAHCRMDYLLNFASSQNTAMWFMERSRDIIASICDSEIFGEELEKVLDCVKFQMRLIRREGDYKGLLQVCRVCYETVTERDIHNIIKIMLLNEYSAATLLNGDFKEAFDLAKTAIDLCDRVDIGNGLRARVECNYAYCLMMLGKYKEAEQIFVTSTETMINVYGGEDPDTIYYLFRLGLVYYYQEKYKEQLENHLHIYELRRKVLGERNTETINSLRYVGLGYIHNGKEEEGIKCLNQAYEKGKECIGETHPITLETLQDISKVILKNDPKTALEYAEKIVSIRIEKYGEDHVRTLNGKEHLGDCLKQNGLEEKAAEVYRDVLDGIICRLGEEHPNVQRVKNKLEIQ